MTTKTRPTKPIVKTTDNGGQYRIENKTLIWIPEQWEGETEIPEIRLPLRVKVKAFTKVKVQNPDTPQEMLQMLGELFPSQAENLAELDLFELGDLFGTWATEFQNRNQVSLGEA